MIVDIEVELRMFFDLLIDILILHNLSRQLSSHYFL